MITYWLSEKILIIRLIVVLRKEISLYKISYYSQPDGHIKIKMDVLSNYVTKPDVEKATEVDALEFAKKLDLASWKSVIDKLNIYESMAGPNKTKTIPVDLKNLNDVVDKVVVKNSI